MVIFKFRNLKTGQATPIPPGEFSVGRADDAYVHVDDGSVSRRHATIFNGDEGFFVEDLGSSNGTAAHGAFITGRMKVEFGDVIHVGSVAFRIDPEVAGEAVAAPSAGLRTSDRDYMRRDTERLIAPGEAPRVVETLSAEQLLAPEVDQVTDADAEDLNAITIREPEPAPAARLPIIRPGGTPLTKQTPASPAAATSPPPYTAPPRPQPQMGPAGKFRPSSALTTSPSAAASPAAAPSLPRTETLPAPGQNPPATQETGINWGLLLIVFLAGMGTGLLLGLCFARIFIELGGKASGLP